ncbi:hypothetical protein GCM10023317_73150 [Actinopolymorpha pittospori]
MPTWLEIVIGIVAAVLVCWLLLVAVMWTAKPSGPLLKEALRLLPDLLRLLRSQPTRPCPAGCESGSAYSWSTWPSPST